MTEYELVLNSSNYRSKLDMIHFSNIIKTISSLIHAFSDMQLCKCNGYLVLVYTFSSIGLSIQHDRTFVVIVNKLN